MILPDATILLDYMLAKTTGLVEGLVVRPERMRENIERGLGLHASSRVLLALVEKAGLSREDAYAIVQRNALRAADERVPLHGLLATDPAVAGPAAAGGPRRLLRRRGGAPARAGGDRAPGRARGRDRRPRWTHDREEAPMPLADAFVRSGKVRDLYRRRRRPAAPGGASDRLSAFDVVLPTPIPDKGRMLTGLSRFWFAETADIVRQPPAVHGPGRPAGRSSRAATRRSSRTCAAG